MLFIILFDKYLKYDGFYLLSSEETLLTIAITRLKSDEVRLCVLIHYVYLFIFFIEKFKLNLNELLKETCRVMSGVLKKMFRTVIMACAKF